MIYVIGGIQNEFYIEYSFLTLYLEEQYMPSLGMQLMSSLDTCTMCQYIPIGLKGQVYMGQNVSTIHIAQVHDTGN